MCGSAHHHFEKQEVSELLDVVTVREPVVEENIAVVPQLLNDLLRVVVHSRLPRSYGLRLNGRNANIISILDLYPSLVCSIRPILIRALRSRDSVFSVFFA